MNIAFIPIDNRPVCYTLPEQIAKLNNSIRLFLPERKYLGDLKKPCDTEKILNWLENLSDIETVVISLDTIAYGGLIPSRRSKESFETVKKRLERLKKILNSKKVYGFSSIMRISNNNINEEEKEYWSEYGKKIFEYSYNFHKNGQAETDVPKEILDDYLKTRKRNFEINKMYLEWQQDGFFKTLIFSKDDCAEYGLNIMEAEELGKFIRHHYPRPIGERAGERGKLENAALIKTGADEIPLSLLSRAITDTISNKIKVCPIFTEPEYKNLISNYEDLSVDQSVISQLELAGCEVSMEKDADILLYVNNFREHQGEIVMKIPTEQFNGVWQTPEKQYIAADVRFANGADNSFVEKMFKSGLGRNFSGYSGWNTTANTLGSLICTMVMLSAQGRSSSYTDERFKKLQIIRFLDDWAYQANVRQMLEKPDSLKCKELMKPFEEKLWQIFDVKYNVEYKFPWNRLFEVEVVCQAIA